MDIFAIIKENLPDGVEIGDKTIKAIAKEISTQQGQEFIPKESYSKKTERIDELEKEIKELQGKAADTDGYKAKYEAEIEAHKQTKTAIETEKALNSKKATLHKHLAEEKGNPKGLHLLEKEFDLDKIEIEGEGETAKIKNWEQLVKPVKEKNSFLFGDIVTTGANVANPPQKGTVNDKDAIRIAAERAMGIVSTKTNTTETGE